MSIVQKIIIQKNKILNFIEDKRFSEIFSGSVWALSAKLIATGFGLISSVIVAQFYGAEVLGVLAILNSFMLLASIFTVMGTNTSVLRLIPEHLTKYSPTSAFKLYRKARMVAVVASILIVILTFLFADLFANKIFFNTQLSYYLRLASVIVFFKSIMILCTSVLRSLGHIRLFALMQSLPQSFNLIVLVLMKFLWLDNDYVPVYSFFLAFALTGIVGWIVVEVAFRIVVRPLDKVRNMSYSEILSISLPMMMTSTMTFVIGQTGIIMLGIFRSEVDVGYYSIAVKLATLTAFILGAINSMAAPKFSELFHSCKIDELFFVAKKSAKLAFWTTTPILFGLVVFGKSVLIICFGNEFIVAYPALLFLIFGQFVNSISGATGLFMNMTDGHIVFRNIILITMLLNIVSNIVLIKLFGVLGAALSSMLSFWVWNLLTLCYMKFKFGQTTAYFPYLA